MRIIGDVAAAGASPSRPRTIELDDDQFRPR